MKYFIPRYEHWYMYMLHYPSRYRCYVTLLIFLAIVGSWYIMLYCPFKRSIGYYINTNVSLRAQMQEQGKAQELCSTLSKSIKGLERDLHAYQAVPLDSNELITYAATQAISANLLLTTCATEPIIDHGWCQIHPIIIDVHGPLNAVVQWLKTVSAKTKLISVPSAAITRTDQAMVQCSATIAYLNVRSIS